MISPSRVEAVRLLPLVSTGAPITGELKQPRGVTNLRIAVSGTGTFTLQIRGVIDGVSSALTVWDTTKNGFLTNNNITAAGIYDIDVQGFDGVQAHVATLTGGNVAVTGRWLA